MKQDDQAGGLGKTFGQIERQTLAAGDQPWFMRFRNDARKEMSQTTPVGIGETTQAPKPAPSATVHGRSTPELDRMERAVTQYTMPVVRAIYWVPPADRELVLRLAMAILGETE